MKKYLGWSLSINFIRILYLSMSVFSIISFIFFCINFKLSYIFILFLIVGVFLWFTISLIMTFTYTIQLNDALLYTNGQKGINKKETIQFPERILLIEISSLKIEYSNTNSLFKTIQTLILSSYANKKYLEFTLTNGQKKRFWIDNFSKKQVIRLLGDINGKISHKFNVEEIMKGWIR